MAEWRKKNIADADMPKECGSVYTALKNDELGYTVCQKGCGEMYIGRASVDSTLTVPQKTKFRASCLLSLLKGMQWGNQRDPHIPSLSQHYSQWP